MRRTGPNLSVVKRLEMANLYLAGTPAKVVAEKYGVHENYVRIAVRRMGQSRKPVEKPRERPLIKAAGC